MEPLDYLRTVVRRWRVVLACAFLAGAGAWLTAPASGPADQATAFVSFSATATLLTEPSTDRSLAYTKLFMERGELPRKVADALGTGESGPSVASRVQVTTDDAVGTIGITAIDSDAARVEHLVNTYATVTIAHFDQQAEADVEARLVTVQQRLDDAAGELAQLDRQASIAPLDSIIAAQQAAKSAQYQALLQQRETVLAQPQTSGLTVLEPAVALQQGAAGFAPPTDRKQRLLLGLLVGGALGVVLALLVERVDTRVRGRREVQELTSTSVLAEVPRLTRAQRRTTRPPVVEEPQSAYAEAHRAVRSGLALLTAHAVTTPYQEVPSDATHEPPSRVVLVVSPRAGEGKSTTVVNLAATIAAAGRTVVVIDADLHHPTLGTALGVPRGQGLADLASTAGDARDDLEALLRPTRLPGVRLLDAGTPERFEAVSPGRLLEVLRRTRDLADVVLVDVAPLLSASDALDLVQGVDSALLVVRAGRTTREQLQHATEILGRTRVPVVGSVLVGATRVQRPAFGRGSEGRGRALGMVRSSDLLTSTSTTTAGRGAHRKED